MKKSIQKNYIKANELTLGATYRTKDNKEYIYMGRFDYWTTKSERIERKSNSWRGYFYDYIYHDVNKGKHHYFIPKRQRSSFILYFEK